MKEVYGEIVQGKYIVQMDGHADGDPIVCSAISGITYALLGYLINATEDGLAIPYKNDVAPGHVDIMYGIDDDIIPVFHMFMIGLMQIEKKYPDLIRCEINF